MIGNYNNGLFQGKWIYYDVYGNIVGAGNYDHGTGVLKSWWGNGNIQREIPYSNNLKHGAEKIYNADGELIEVLFYDKGVELENP